MAAWTDATALVVVDVQLGFEEPRWGERNNPGAEENIAALIAAWRDQTWPVVFVRHNSADPASPLREGLPGFAFKPAVQGDPDLLVTKSAHSAFYGDPDLHAWLQGHGISSIAICGIQTNVCCETTARMGSDLGYSVLFIADATYTFDLVPHNGPAIRARDLARATSLLIDAEFGKSVHTEELLGGGSSA